MSLAPKKSSRSLRHRRIDAVKRFYLVLCVVGFLVPYWQFVPWVMEHGVNLPLFVRELFANRISSFFGLDVLVSAAVLCIFIVVEGSRLGMRLLWLPMVATCVVGVSLGLPLFLYLRQGHLHCTAGEQAFASKT
jgi:Terpene cyclase DEP1